MALTVLTASAGCGQGSTSPAQAGQPAPSPAATAIEGSGALPPTYEYRGVTLQLDGHEVVEAVFVDDTSGSVLRVTAGQDLRFGGEVSHCAPLAVVVVSEETDESVTVDVGRYAPREPLPDQVGCAAVGGGPFQLQARLQRPLGQRTVLDGSFGEVRVHTPEQLPPPARIPDGYTGGQLEVDVVGLLSRRWEFGDDGARTLTLTRTEAATPFVLDERHVVVLESTVHGDPAVAWQAVGFEADGLCLSWVSKHGVPTAFFLCSGGSPTVSLDAADLVDVAESMPVPTADLSR